MLAAAAAGGGRGLPRQQPHYPLHNTLDNGSTMHSLLRSQIPGRHQLGDWTPS